VGASSVVIAGERKPICSVLHLSDLHLGANFADVGGKQRGFLKAVTGQKAYVLQAHDHLLLLVLPLEIYRIATINRARRGKARADDKLSQGFDRIVVSGDISTDATDGDRFVFAHKFLTTKSPLAAGIYGQQASVGLGLPNELLLCVPGNHDKFRETTLDRFNGAFSGSPAPCNYVKVIRRFGRVLVFIGMDTNAYVGGNIAKGEIDLARLGWLAQVLNTMQTEGLADGEERLKAEEWEQAIKCLVIHHHACGLSFKKRHFNPMRSFTEMEGADKLLKLIAGKIQVVLHGHEHYPTHFFHKESGALIVSAGTTSQWHKKPGHNSFYNLTFYEDKSIQIEESVWKGTGFIERERLNGKKAAPVYQLR
jgi:predicted phosphodiesterase